MHAHTSKCKLTIFLLLIFFINTLRILKLTFYSVLIQCSQWPEKGNAIFCHPNEILINAIYHIVIIRDCRRLWRGESVCDR